jgi:hypothetical protein
MLSCGLQQGLSGSFRINGRRLVHRLSNGICLSAPLISRWLTCLPSTISTPASTDLEISSIMLCFAHFEGTQSPILSPSYLLAFIMRLSPFLFLAPLLVSASNYTFSLLARQSMPCPILKTNIGAGTPCGNSFIDVQYICCCGDSGGCIPSRGVPGWRQWLRLLHL